MALKIGVDIGDRLSVNAKKIKFAINGPLPKDSAFPNFRDFEVTHHYLQTASRTMQSRLRKRGRYNKYLQTKTYFNKHFEPVLVCCGFFLTVR